MEDSKQKLLEIYVSKSLDLTGIRLKCKVSEFFALPFVSRDPIPPVNMAATQKKIPWNSNSDNAQSDGFSKGRSGGQAYSKQTYSDDDEDIEWDDVEEAGQNFTFKKIDEKEKESILKTIKKDFTPVKIP